MTRSPPSSHDTKDAWHWLGLAISLSFSLGLNRSNLQLSNHPRRRYLERRVWWTAFIRDRSLALDAGAEAGWARPMRIRREDCDVEMLSLEDFDAAGEKEEDDGIEEMRARSNANTCVEKAKLCWCCDEILASNFSSTWTPQQPPLLTLQAVFNAQQGDMQQAPEFVQPPRKENLEAPTFESQEELEYNMAPSSSSPSASDDCLTPREYDDAEFMEEDENETENLVCSSPLGAGYGVDGEYDDYLEYLKAPVTEKEIFKRKERERSSWAFQLDCENGRVVQV